ncbi:MAG: hypothetical protein IKJ73_07260 [Lachnospiraceae bacterium]|nr:hypothetical protein [Lachnospiraceae bacterium]
MKIAIIILLSFVLGMFFMDYIISKHNDSSKKEDLIKKISLYYHTFNLWMDIKQQGVDVAGYMKKQGYERVAIYGMKELGERLYVELTQAEIDVICVIDGNKNVLGDFKLLSPNDDIPEIDVLIVTAEYYFDEINNKMEKKVNCPILKLSELLCDASGIAWR